MARDNQWYREGEGGERYLLADPVVRSITTTNAAALAFSIAGHGRPLGTLHHDGLGWRWEPQRSSALPPLVRDTKPGRLPAFIESLLPEGWLESVLSERDEREALRNGRRYMSNITVVPQGQVDALPKDILGTSLTSFLRGGRFSGRYAGPMRGQLDQTFEKNLARLFESNQTPRLSGVQIEAPMSLLGDGSLVPAVGRPFTHILKPAGTAGFEHLPSVEWACLELGRTAGFQVPAAALMTMPDAMPPALVVERFDIRHSSRERRMLALEDFCSVLDLPASAKYDATIERVAKALRAVATNPDADLDVLLRRAIFAWLIADGDMHLKNLAVIKTATFGTNTFSSVRLAPLYDSVCTRVFPKLAGDRMALKLNGKDDRLAASDFVATAKTIGLTSRTAAAACRELSDLVEARASKLQLPAFVRRIDGARSMHESLVELAIARCQALRKSVSSRR